MLKDLYFVLKQSANLERAPHVLLICPHTMHLYRFANSQGTKKDRPQNVHVLHN